MQVIKGMKVLAHSIHMNGMEVECVSSFKFCGPLKWTWQINTSKVQITFPFVKLAISENRQRATPIMHLLHIQPNTRISEPFMFPAMVYLLRSDHAS